MSKTEDGIKTVITSLFELFEKETIENNQDAFVKLSELYKKDAEFWHYLERANSTLGTIISMITDVPNQKYGGTMSHIASGVYQHFIRTLIEKREGGACSADKERFIVRSTIKALRENKNLSLYDDYVKHAQITEDKDKRAYWSPRTIKDTDQAMSLFWIWYQLKVPEEIGKNLGGL